MEDEETTRLREELDACSARLCACDMEDPSLLVRAAELQLALARRRGREGSPAGAEERRLLLGQAYASLDTAVQLLASPPIQLTVEIGHILHELGHDADAHEAYLRAEAIDPTVKVVAALAASFRRGGDEAAMWRLLEKHAPRSPEHALLWIDRIEGHGGWRSSPESLDESARAALVPCRRALDWFPEAASVHGKLAALLQQQDDHEGSVAAYGRALDLAPSPSTPGETRERARMLRGRQASLEALGRGAEAARDEADANAIDPPTNEPRMRRIFG